MDIDWNATHCFVVVARCGSLTEASNTLKLSVPTLTRRIDALEGAVGTLLLRRGPRGATPTAAGRALLEHAQSAARHMAHMTRAARVLIETPMDVPVRISSTESMIADVLAPKVSELHAVEPALKLELDVSNALSDLSAGDVDIAIRMVRPTLATLIASKLPVIRMGLYCSRRYLARRDVASLTLADEQLLWLDRSFGDIAENQWLEKQNLEPAVKLRAVSVRALQNAAIAGNGIAPLPVFSAEAAGLVRVPSRTFPQRHPWLVFHRDTRNDKRMTTVRQWVISCCKTAFG
ncbi:MAG: LysR family transcriptional regulator [Pseudomonadota bacterium]